MARTVSIGNQDFETIIKNNYFYVDKTDFIREWWKNGDNVTLITRPRRFGKTLNMNMLERFFSVKFVGKGEIFEGLDIWKDEEYRALQGTYPVIFMSFAGVKANNYEDAKKQIFLNITDIYSIFEFLKDNDAMGGKDRDYFDRIGIGMDDADAVMSLNHLAKYFYDYYGKKAIILLDEYDTPMLEAYVSGYWEQLAPFMRNLFNNTFKTNPYLERAMMTGITRISKESFFSDLNHLRVVTVTSNKYARYFGFTEEEVFAAMDEFGMENKNEAKQWYDGFTIGNLTDIYNPWSIINLLDEGKLKPYWVNTSSDVLISNILQKSDKDTKMQFEGLLQGKTLWSEIDEDIAFNQLDDNENALWSLLLASGYLKAVHINGKQYELDVTNYEVRQGFESMVSRWFGKTRSDYNGFVKALLRDDLEEMNLYLSDIAESVFGSFDGGSKPSLRKTPERFYHGFVLGLLVDLKGRYELKSNKESGLGRYDVMLKPLNAGDNGIVMEFKVFDPKREKSLDDTVVAALRQIDEKGYERELLDGGIKAERIRKYGFAFEGKRVMIGSCAEWQK